MPTNSEEAFLAKMHERRDEMTIRALMVIFDFDRAAAEAAVTQKMRELPKHLRDRVDHDDPTSVAARIAGKRPADLSEEPYKQRMRQYDSEVRPAFERAALDDHKTHVKPQLRVTRSARTAQLRPLTPSD